MWLFTDRGFYSVVNDGDAPAGHLLVRAHVRDDLEWLAARLGQPKTEIRYTGDADYAYRMTVRARILGAYVAEYVEGIQYGSFAGRVGALQGPERARIYQDVRSALLPLQRTSARKERKRR